MYIIYIYKNMSFIDMFYNIKEIMNYELYLLRLLLKKETYNKYSSYINYIKYKDTLRELYYLFSTLKEFHSKIPSDISVEEFSLFFYTKYPDVDRNVYDNMFNMLQQADVSDDAAESILSNIAAKQQALDISELAYKAAQGVISFDEMYCMLAEKQKVDHHTSGIEAESTDLEELISHAVTDEGLRWRLDCLNKSLGGLRTGDFGFIFSRPESGKTAFVVSEGSYWLNQIKHDEYIVHYNNEEQNSKVMLRYYQGYFGATLEQILSNVPKYKGMWREQVGDKLKFFGIERCNKADVEAINKEYKPKAIIYDQLSKFTGFSADRDDLKLGAIFQWAREQAKMYGAGIGVHQAEGSAEGQKWLTMAHCANAKTSIQAEADWILGIGKQNDHGMEYTRFLSICKNKLLGSSDSIPELRHGRLECLINPSIMRYEDLIKYG